MTRWITLAFAVLLFSPDVWGATGPINVSSATKQGNYAFVVAHDFGTPADDSNNLTRSTLRIFENGTELLPAHAPHADIRSTGNGRFSHWQTNLYFSSSDRTNPKKNGRAYTYSTTTVTVPPPPPPPTPLTPPPSGTKKYPPETTYNGSKSVSFVTRPGYLSSYIDPAFGTKVTRVSDESLNVDASHLINCYPKTQPWNSDMSLVMLCGAAVVLNGSDYTVYKKPGWHNDARWSTVDPNSMFYTTGSQFRKWNVRTGADVLVRSFTEGNIKIGNGEGNISVGDKYVALMVGTLVIVYDIPNNTIVAKKDVGSVASDWASMSQSGDKVVLSNNGGAGVWSYDRMLNPIKKLFGMAGHADIGYDIAGVEVYAQVCVPMAYARLSDGSTTNLLPSTQDCGHLSARSYQRTGWVLKSGEGEVYAIKLNGSGIVQRWAHERTRNNTYENSAMGVVSPDGTKVMWNSDFCAGGTGAPGCPVYAYIAEMP